MSIPQAVLRQAQRSDELLANLAATPGTDAQEVVTNEAVAPAPAPAPVTTETPSTQQATEGNPQGATEQTPAKKPVDWQHKYRVLEGKYRAEVPRLHEARRELEGKLADATREIEKLRGELEPYRAASQSGGEPNFDPELLAHINAQIATVADKVVKERVAPVVREREQSAAEHLRGEFEQNLTDYLIDSHGVDWRDLDGESSWHQYLARRDRFTGVTRQELLNSAVIEGDAGRAAALFQDWLDTDGAAFAQRPVRQAPVAAPRPAVDPSVQAQLVPQTAAGGGVIAPEKPIYKRAEVAQFYTDYAKAQTNRRTPPNALQSMRAKDAEIQLALKEGRVR